jgi:hypothetical protein
MNSDLIKPKLTVVMVAAVMVAALTIWVVVMTGAMGTSMNESPLARKSLPLLQTMNTATVMKLLLHLSLQLVPKRDLRKLHLHMNIPMTTPLLPSQPIVVLHRAKPRFLRPLSSNVTFSEVDSKRPPLHVPSRSHQHKLHLIRFGSRQPNLNGPQPRIWTIYLVFRTFLVVGLPSQRHRLLMIFSDSDHQSHLLRQHISNPRRFSSQCISNRRRFSNRSFIR